MNREENSPRRLAFLHPRGSSENVSNLKRAGKAKKTPTFIAVRLNIEQWYAALGSASASRSRRACGAQTRAVGHFLFNCTLCAYRRNSAQYDTYCYTLLPLRAHEQHRNVSRISFCFHSSACAGLLGPFSRACKNARRGCQNQR